MSRARPAALPPDEDGYELWLRYRPLPPAERRRLARWAQQLVLPREVTALVQSAAGELERALGAMLGRVPPRAKQAGNGALQLALPRSAAALRALGLGASALDDLGDEGYLLRATRQGGVRRTLIAAHSERGLLYGAFAWLRALGCGADPAAIDERSAPPLPLRLLNHWDNLDRSVERGYAGASIWDWWKLPAIVDRRYTDYARANASLGINGVSLNNVNARPEILSAPWLQKVRALADVLRPWGQKVYLAVRFSSPRELGGLPSADPLDAGVRRWWAAKADEIYALIPDFGGFVVKANSEGQPGPQDYGRSHADGANALAAALAPHGGLLLWRAFVYAAENPRDRALQAYDEFVPLDGQFAPNVIVQVKNGPIDFQPREPFHPLFGAMPGTPLMMEFQVTKEYLGFSTHLAYLGPMYEEALKADTERPQPGTPVAQTLLAPKMGGITAVGNVGADRNWSGSHFDQANWYAYGRLAWNPMGSAEAIAAEWTQQTFGSEPALLRPVLRMLMTSREAVVDYMTPLGLHHLMDTGHHHGPGPWVSELKRPEWNPTYYHRADAQGIGFDRTTGGSGAVDQYAPGLAARWGAVSTTPEALLLWFHHLPWTHRMASRRTLWHELVTRYDRGVAAVAALQADWQHVRPFVDARRFDDVAQHLAQQKVEAQWWRDASVAYFQSVNGLALPRGARKPPLPLAAYQATRFPFAPH